MPNKTVIFAGGPVEDTNYIKPYLNTTDEIICADSGAIIAEKLGITPSTLVGDFDSIPPELLEKYNQNPDIKVINAAEQDAPDLQKALCLVDKNTQRIEIFGALGGRLDHLLGNILTLENHPNPDRFALHDADQEVRLLSKDFTFEGKIGDKIGIIPIRPICNLSYDGLFYPAHGLPGPYTLGWLGTSNELSKNKATIHIDSGLAIFIHYKSQN